MPKLFKPPSPADNWRGAPNAPLILVEYGDFQCPDCVKAYPIVGKLEQAFGPALAVVFRHFPLSQMHPLAEPAALLAEAAGRFGKFWELYDYFFSHGDAWTLDSAVEYALTLGISRQDLDAARGDAATKEKIQSDFKNGVRSGVAGTPTFFVNGERFSGSVTFESLQSALQAVA